MANKRINRVQCCISLAPHVLDKLNDYAEKLCYPKSVMVDMALREYFKQLDEEEK